MARVNIGNIWQEVGHRSRIFANRRDDGREFSRAWSTATAILLEINLADIEEATITTARAADDDGANEDEVKKKKASRQAFEG